MRNWSDPPYIGQHADVVRSDQTLRQSVEASYFQQFLPLAITDQELRALRDHDSGLTTWTGSDGRALAFMPAPPSRKCDPDAKPERLSRTNARLKQLRAFALDEKVEVALGVIDALLAATDKVAVAFSGGRDSLVALHLVRQRRPDVQVVFVNTGIEFPETITYVRKLAKEWRINLHEARPKRNFWKLARERGLPIGGRGNGFFMKDLAQKADVKLANACCNQLKITPARQFYSEVGTEGVVTGLRVDESLMRKLNFADYGALRFSRDYGTLVAWPLYAWLQPDIDAYVARHTLPLNPIYGMGHQRVGCWSCMHDMLYPDSRLFKLKETHPGMYHTLKRQFGDDMLRVLKVWGNVEHRDFTMDHFDGLYSPCGLDLLRSNARERKKRDGAVSHMEADDNRPTSSAK